MTMQLWELYKGKDYHIEPTLERIKRAVEYINYPNRKYLSLLVGGTNGKGSTCAFTESILRHHGYKTGWFVSPHLVREEERWRINSELIDEDTLKAYVNELRRVFEKFELTYFEAATLIAIQYFRDVKVDIAVFEVGLGGRWDATKICEPSAVAITNVERDHTRWLGRSIWEIAKEKVELYREGSPLVIGSARYPLYPAARSKANLKDLKVAGIDFNYYGEVRKGETFLKHLSTDTITLKDAELGLWGRWQIDNAALSVKLAEEVIRLKGGTLIKALWDTRLEGRMEILRKDPLFMVDGAHNPYAVEKVVSEVAKYIPDIDILFTGLREKEWKESMRILRKFTDKIYLLEVSHHRGEPIEKLVEEARKLQYNKIKVFKSSREVLEYEEPMLALGSLYLVGEIKKLFLE